MAAEADEVLGRHPDRRQPDGRRRCAAIDMAVLARLQVARAVVDEAMRLHPPAWLITRSTTADMELGGSHVPAGSLVILSPWIVHRHPTVWEEPEEFRPDRFLAGAAGPAPGLRTAYIPFGAGPRMCIGRDFAYAEAVLSPGHDLPRGSAGPVGAPGPRAAAGDDPARPAGADAGHAALTRADPSWPAISPLGLDHQRLVVRRRRRALEHPTVGQRQRDRQPGLVDDDHAVSPTSSRLATTWPTRSTWSVAGRSVKASVRARTTWPVGLSDTTVSIGLPVSGSSSSVRRSAWRSIGGPAARAAITPTAERSLTGSVDPLEPAAGHEEDRGLLGRRTRRGARRHGGQGTAGQGLGLLLHRDPAPGAARRATRPRAAAATTAATRLMA